MERSRPLPAFADVDAAPHPEAWVQSLDRRSADPVVEAIRDWFGKALRIAAGHVVLEVGCGTGDQAVRLAGLTGPTGRVIAIDMSETMIKAAVQRATNAEEHLEFRRGDASDLDLEDNVVDRAFCDNLLVYLPHPERAFSELARVVKPGGRVLAFEPDFETMVIDHPDRHTTRVIVNHYVDSFPSGWVGRQLPRLFREAGLTDIEVAPLTRPYASDTRRSEYGWQLPLDAPAGVPRIVKPAIAAGALSRSEAVLWLDRLGGAVDRGTYFVAVTGFAVIGTKG